MTRALDYTVIAAQDFACPQLQELHDTLRVMDGCWRAARAAGVDHQLLRQLVRNYRDASHSYQTARFGKVRTRVSVAALLR